MNNQFKVGTNFDLSLIDFADELNHKYEGQGQIKEWFGCAPDAADMTARPDWRLPQISNKQFEEYVKLANDKGQQFNVVLNSIQPYMTKPLMVANKQKIQDYVKYLEDIGVYRITVANPMMAMFIREVSNIELEASCIMHLDAVTQMKYLHETLGINKFCCSILKNRNLNFLKNASKYCKENGLILELLTQEFCGNAGEGYATHCVYRDSCYICHGTCKTKEDSMAYDNYPMKFCMYSRDVNEENWIRMRFIRPEDIKKYNEKTGVDYWKISGRTGGSDYIKMCMEAYMSQHYDGNVVGLWKPLSSIYNGKDEKDSQGVENIPNHLLDGFIDHWLDSNFDCADEVCGTTCKYCRNFWVEKIKPNVASGGHKAVLKA